MKYQKIYDMLIDRAKNRLLDEYTETHHILPKCLGGRDSKDNLVELTPEEHYTAHLLLIKLHPKNDALLYAARMMTVCSKYNKERINNKQYGWLKRRYLSTCRTRTGKKNPMWDKRWISNSSGEIKLIPFNELEEYLSNGWQNRKKFRHSSRGQHDPKLSTRKLSSTMINEIRNSNSSINGLSKKFNVDRNVIRKIKRRETYREI